MIGEKIKIGFDGSEVKRGMGGIMGSFGKLNRGLGRGFRQIGIGAARHMGASLLGVGMRMASAIPNEIKALADLRQEFFALNDATGASVDGMLALRDAIAKTSNISPQMASNTLKEMTSRIGEATQFGTMAFKGMEKIGVSPVDLLLEKDPLKQLEQIAKGYKKLREDLGAQVAADTMKDIFGARIGRDITPLLLNYESAMKRSRIETAGVAKGMNDMSKSLDSIDDIQRAFSYKLSETALSFLRSMDAAGVDAKYISDSIMGLDINKYGTSAAKFIKDTLDQIKSGGLWEWIKTKFNEIKDWIADAIAKGIQKGIEKFTGDGIKGGVLGKILGLNTASLKDGGKTGSGFGSDTSTASLDSGKIWNFIKEPFASQNQESKQIEQNTGRTNDLLERYLNTNRAAVLI